MSVSHTSADAVPAHALRRGTRGFAAVVLFLTGMIVFAVTAFVLPSIALSSTMLTALVLLGIGFGIAHLVAIYGVIRRRPWAVSLTLYLLAIGLGLVAFGSLLLLRAGVDLLAPAGAESTAQARIQSSACSSGWPARGSLPHGSSCAAWLHPSGAPPHPQQSRVPRGSWSRTRS